MKLSTTYKTSVEIIYQPGEVVLKMPDGDIHCETYYEPADPFTGINEPTISLEAATMHSKDHHGKEVILANNQFVFAIAFDIFANTDWHRILKQHKLEMAAA